MAKRLPKEKITLSLYINPKTREKLECLQQLNFIAGKRFSMSEIVEESINQRYGIAYYCLHDKFWIKFFKATNFIESSESAKEGINETIEIIEKKPAAAGEILKVQVSIKENFMKEFKSTFGKLFTKFISK